MHEADEPDFVGDLLDADGLTGEDLAEVNLATADEMRPQRVTVMVRSWKGYSSSVKR